MERNATLENTAKEIANLIVSKCVHPVSNRPYTLHQIRDAMKQAEISVQPISARSVKQQFLDCVKVIQQKQILDIQRAKMELAISLPSSESSSENNDISSLIQLLKQNAKASNIEHIIENQRINFLIDPSMFRVVDNLVQQCGAKLEILRQTVKQEGDVDVNFELERNTLIQQSRNDNYQAQTSTVFDNYSDDYEEELTSNQLSKLMLSNDSDEEEEQNEDSDDHESINMASARKKNKKAAKKSKKAKRREKEEESIRKERMEAEKVRQEERNFRLGLNSQDNNNQSETIFSSTNNATDNGEGSRKSCNTCGGSFNPSQYRSHFRSDWHRYNMKLKMKGIAPIDEKEFLLIDSDAFFNNDMM